MVRGLTVVLDTKLPLLPPAEEPPLPASPPTLRGMDSRTLHEAASLPDPVERARALTRLMTEDQGLTDAAARYRRQAIADAREQGMSREQIAAALGVTPPRITQITKGPAAKAPAGSADSAPRVLVQRSIPTPPADRGS